ncbi:hypothetical protein D3C86_1316460 [compost metagenome]
MSVIRRSRRRTSCCSRLVRRALCSSVLTRGRVSRAERIEVRGFLISWLTSAAKRSMASIRVDRVSVIDSRARARSPISSLRSSRSGREMARARCRRTWSAAADRRITGRATNRCSTRADSRFTARATRAKGVRARRCAARVSSTSPASRVRTPRTCWTWRTGRETETTRSPFSLRRMSAWGAPCRARSTSAESSALARLTRAVSRGESASGARAVPAGLAGAKA